MTKSTMFISSSTATGTTAIGGEGGTVPAGGGGAHTARNVPSAVTFTLTPGQANSPVHINYTLTTGIKIFNSDILNLTELFGG